MNYEIWLLAFLLCHLFPTVTPMMTCDEGCHFNEPLITSESIKKWPTTCITVCGNITINEKTNIAQKEFNSGFQFFFSLVGNVKVENTNYTSLSFLDRLVNLYSDFEIKGELIIRSNPLLTDINAIWNWSPQSPYNLEIANNSLLDMSLKDDCHSLLYVLDMDYNVHGNLKDCPCQGVHITPDSPRYNQNCTRIVGGFSNGISVSNIDSGTDLSSFLNLKILSGSLAVQNTQLQNLSFLENLSSMELNQSGYNAMVVQNNPNLTRLGLSSLKLLTGGEISMVFMKNHPDFCITTNELQLIAMHNVQFYYGFDTKLCRDLYRKDGEKVCIFGDLSTMDKNCQHMIGDVTINSDNEKFVNKLRNVTYIYGFLSIMNTEKLEDTYFLQLLKQIVAVNYDKSTPLIRINKNKKLGTVFFNNMKTRPWAYAQEDIIEIKGNDLEIFNNQKACLLVQKLTQTSIKYNQKSCDKLPKPELIEGTRIPVSEDIGSGGDEDEEEDGGEIVHISRTMTYSEIGVRGDEEDDDFDFNPVDMNNPMIGNTGETFGNENCFFYDFNIDRYSIEKWPTACAKVCGNITINAYTNLTGKELTPIFKNLTSLIGNLKIEYTNLKSLEFLNSNLNFWFDYFNRTGIIAIRGNPLLTNVSSLVYWNTYTPFTWHIIDNPKLNFELYCIKRYGDNSDFNVYGNLKNCGCKIVRIGPKSLPYYPNCTRIVGGMDNGLKITQVNISMDLSGLLNLKTLIGNIEVYETSLQNISFLENLSLMEFNYSSFNWLDIHDNPKLTRLGLGSLKTLLSSYDSYINQPNMRKRMRIVNNHPDFCISTNELQLLAKHNVQFCLGFEAKLCQDLYRKDREKVCYFGDLSKMDGDCQHIIGDVLVNSENENYVKKLGNVTHIYGSLAIEGTKELTDTSFLMNLQQVAAIKLGNINLKIPLEQVSVDDKPLIRFNDNKKLQRVFLQNMKTRPWPYENEDIIEINGNDLEIFKSQRECLIFQKLTQTSIKYNRLSCDKLPSANATTNPTNEVNSNPGGGGGDEEEDEGTFHTGSTSEPASETTTKSANIYLNPNLFIICFTIISIAK